jgi:hypothetical protein
MILKHLFVTNSIISAVFGLGLMVAPGTICAFYGQHLDISGYSNTRMWGTAIFGYALLHGPVEALKIQRHAGGLSSLSSAISLLVLQHAC